MKGYEVVARTLLSQGVHTLFGLMGDGNMFHIASYRAAGGRYLGTVHEAGALSMADGFARASGGLAVASVTHGPGAANTVNPLLEAVRAHSPVLLVTGDTPASVPGHSQSVDLAALFHGTGARYHRVLSPEHIADDVCRLARLTLVSGVPTVVNIPLDMQMAEVSFAEPRAGDRPPLVIPPDEAALDKALGILASARRPLILAGRGAALSNARAELVALADRLGAPLATTLSAKDFFLGHPFDLGIMGSVGHQSAMDVIVKADCIAAFGAGLNDYTTVDGGLLDGKAVIHCDVDLEAFNRYSPVDAAVHADARATAAAMVEQLAGIDWKPASFRTDELGPGVVERPLELGYVDATNDHSLDVRTASKALDELFPPERLVITDIGRYAVAVWRSFHVQDPLRFMHSQAWGSIGLGIPMAIGVAAAAPEVPTFAVAGDGGAMMGLIELSTAIRYDIPVIVVVMNDGAYGAEWMKLEQNGFDPRLSLLDQPSLADVAVALGGRAATVTTIEQLQTAAAEALKAWEESRSMLIEIRVDPTVDSMA